MSIWYLLFPVAFLNFLTGFLILRRDYRALVNWAFLALMFSMGSWVLADFFLVSAGNEQTAIFWEGAAHFTGIMIACSMWFFSQLFCGRKFFAIKWTILVLAPVVMGVITFWPGALASGAVLHSWGPEVHIRLFYHMVFIFFFSVFFFSGLFSLLRYSRQVSNRRLARHQAKCLVIGLICAATGGIFFNIVLLSPFIHRQQFVWVGPLFTIFIVLSSYYSGKRYFFGIPSVARAATLMEDMPVRVGFFEYITTLMPRKIA